MNLRNLTRFKTLPFTARDLDGTMHRVFIVKGTFELRHGVRLRPAPEQAPLVFADQYHGEAHASSPYLASDLLHMKPRVKDAAAALAKAEKAATTSADEIAAIESFSGTPHLDLLDPEKVSRGVTVTRRGRLGSGFTQTAFGAEDDVVIKYVKDLYKKYPTAYPSYMTGEETARFMNAANRELERLGFPVLPTRIAPGHPRLLLQEFAPGVQFGQLSTDAQLLAQQNAREMTQRVHVTHESACVMHSHETNDEGPGGFHRCP